MRAVESQTSKNRNVPLHICAVNVLLNNEQILDHCFQTVVHASSNFNEIMTSY